MENRSCRRNMGLFAGAAAAATNPPAPSIPLFAAAAVAAAVVAAVVAAVTGAVFPVTTFDRLAESD